MRNRTRYSTSFSKPLKVTDRNRLSDGSKFGATEYNTYLSYYARYETIIDKTRPKRSKEDRARQQRRIATAIRLLKGTQQRSVLSDLYTESLTINPCTHSKTVLEGLKASVDTCAGAGLVNTITYHGLAGLLHGTAVNSSLSSLITSLSGSTPVNTAEVHHDHDWFALLDSWHETCNSLIPSNTLLGESMVENAIFIDAFKTVLNPSRSVKYVLEFIKGNLGSKKHTPLGKLGRLLRDTSDTNLALQFGVLPAFKEVGRMLTAHTVVQSRMKFLRENVGGYIPIQARQILPSAVETLSNSFFNGSHYGRFIESKDSIAVISALGKVRPDLDYAKDWHAYVQFFGLHKVFGLAWELVPFSFVLDWVTNAGEYVNKYLTPKFDSPFYNIRNISHSVKKQTTYTHYLSNQYLYSSLSAYRNSDNPFITGRMKVTSYNRQAGLPVTSGSVDFSRLGLFHGIVSGSLLLQKGSKLF